MSYVSLIVTITVSEHLAVSHFHCHPTVQTYCYTLLRVKYGAGGWCCDESGTDRIQL